MVTVPPHAVDSVVRRLVDGITSTVMSRVTDPSIPESNDFKRRKNIICPSTFQSQPPCRQAVIDGNLSQCLNEYHQRCLRETSSEALVDRDFVYRKCEDCTQQFREYLKRI